MCTVIRKEQADAPKVAKRDKVVYKICKCDREGSTAISLFQRFEYRVDEVYTTEFSFKNREWAWDTPEKEYLDKLEYQGIDFIFLVKGFHSINSLDRERLRKGHAGAVCKFIVPKGSTYYESEIGNIVSDAIIFKKIVIKDKSK